MTTAQQPLRRTAPFPQPRPYLSIVQGLKLIDIQHFGRSKLAKPRNTAAANADHIEVIKESGRNNALTSMAGSMRRRGMSETSIEAALQTENAIKCDPPLDPAEVRSIAKSISNYAPNIDNRVQESLNDVGNASRFAAAHQADVRFAPGLGWLIWDGLQWKRDATAEITEMAKVVARNIYAEGESIADTDLRVAFAKHARNSHSKPRLDSMIELAKSIPEIVVPLSQLDSDDLLLGVANGVVDLRSGKLRQANPNDLITRHSPVVFDKAAKAPTFMTFLDTVTRGNQPLARYLQQIAGYCLSGLISEQCIFFFYGGGANGKSTFLNVLKQLLGADLAAQTPTETLMLKRSQATNDLARLRDIRLVLANEIEDGTTLAESLVKQITGGDAVTARFHYQEYFEYQPKFKLMMAGNHKPIIRGRDNGIWRRIRLIPFEANIPPSQRDKNLPAKLHAELPGILNWALKGYRDLHKNGGLKTPAYVEKAVEDYRKEMDLLEAWTSACCAVGPTLEWKSSEAYCSYKYWAEQNGYRPMTAGVFSRDLEANYTKVKRKDANYFVGIGPRAQGG